MGWRDPCLEPFPPDLLCDASLLRVHLQTEKLNSVPWQFQSKGKLPRERGLYSPPHLQFNSTGMSQAF